MRDGLRLSSAVPKISGTLTPTAPTANRLLETFTFLKLILQRSNATQRCIWNGKQYRPDKGKSDLGLDFLSRPICLKIYGKNISS